MKTVCMISCCHSLLDDRIYKKEALTLARNGYRLIHIGYGENYKDFYTDDAIRLIQIKKTKTEQFCFSALFRAAQSDSADVYHLHDVELCRIAMKLKRLPHNPKIIYDAHEPFGTNLKDYWRQRSLVKVLLNDIPSLWAEKRILKKVDYLIATEENVASRFRKKNPHTSVIYNYSYFTPLQSFPEEKIYDAIYCGSVSEKKGIYLIVNVLKETKKQGYFFRCVIVGAFNTLALQLKVEAILRREGLEQQVVFTGELPLEQVSEYYRKSKTAFCLFPLSRSNQLILPIKLFEYAAFGLPVIGSDFGHIAEIIQSNKIGVCVNPHDAKEVAAVWMDLISGDKYREYFAPGIHCVDSHYLWETQEAELLRIYEDIHFFKSYCLHSEIHK